MRFSMASLCIIIFVCCVLMSFVTGRLSEGFNSPPATEREGTICKNIDIRNKVENFDKLENCTVIEGSLSILLIEGAKEEQYRQLSFPNLVEITDYLLLYRVYGLKTLSNIFPNLSVIRGQRLFFNFAFVAFEMMDLEELGLIGLTVIERGAVRLEKNPMLCYIDTIDWTRIAKGVDRKDHFIKDNKKTAECVDMCPAYCAATPKSEFENHREIKRCWTYNHCQKNLACYCGKDRFCIHNKTGCCSENCLGGCSGDSSMDCDACKNVIFTDQRESRCRNSCPGGTYMYKNRRCLLEKECLNLKLKLLNDPALGNDYPGQCVADCPAGFTRDSLDNNRCIKCKDTCPKECSAKKVDSVQAAQDLSGCTKIYGALEIRIMKGSNIQQELERNLGQITEINEYLWIHNSHALLSLNFFKKLRVIGGESLVNGFALLVNDNEKLQTLFPKDVENNLTIKSGNLTFHYNRKLCVRLIKTFEKNIKMSKTAPILNDISNSTNGDQAPCHVSTLNLTVFQVTGHVAFLKWDRYKMGDTRALISYVIKYKEAPFQNVSIFEGRDACSDDSWKTRDILNKNTMKNSKTIPALLVQLRPWTQYAVFVQTYMTSSTQYGAMSKLIYFRTAASMPTVPANLKARAVQPGELHVTWDPPNQPNGNVTHYEVYWRRRELDPRSYAPRDYCHNPLATYSREEEDREKEEEEKKNNPELPKQGNCACEISKEELEEEVRERNLQIQFENFLHNSVYLKRCSTSRRDQYRKGKSRRPRQAIPDRVTRQKSSRGNKTKQIKRNKRNVYKEIVDPREFEKYKRRREIPPEALSYNTTETIGPVNVTEDEKEDIPQGTTEHTVLRAVVYSREFIISNLGHFEDYNIEVIACQERDHRDPDKVKYCSSRALTVGRTKKSITADNLNSHTIMAEAQQNKTGTVLIKWKDPLSPNGPIIKYMVEYSKGGLVENPTSLCRTYQQYRKHNGTIIPTLPPGNYSYRVQAYSLAGNGSWSEVRWFFISDKQEPSWSSSTIIAVSVSSVLLIILFGVIVVWLIARSRTDKIPIEWHVSTVNPDYMQDYDAYIPDEWEVERDKVCLLRELGQGSFGMVWEGRTKDLVEKGKETLVAVKTVNENADYHQRGAFLKEASIMKGFKCHHVVRLLGIVSQSQPALVIMELMTNGDLKNYLRMRRPDNEEGLVPPALQQIWQMAGEIADGMAYLSDKKFVHRDLAARNCMVAVDLTVKIGDFGMTRDVYETDYYRKGGKGLLPVRWMAPESLKDGVFTSYSDVWSYGVVLWEMVTLAELPYIGLSHEQVIKYVGSGRTMEKPEGCPDRLHQLMLQCWRFKDKQRPTFQGIIEILVPVLDRSFREKSYFFSVENHTEDNHDGDYPDEDYPDDLWDDSNKPFIAGAEGDSSHHSQSHHSSHGFEDQDEGIKFVDYNYHDRFGTEPCDCILLEETDHRNRNHVDSSYRNSSCSNPNSAIDTSDGSKDSSTSKSSNSSYPINGINLNIVNGHVPVHMRTTPC
ncbi:insulin-like peptide receptor isoform X1 [Mytilus californianus]|uniref:insulin-like peptide receptor isoform X1 n=1 Tax=Mytilus californianus TaxID=6549 RepID=UPI002247F85F|nr:insulin-like peptide receptor isoform X1 [Mytilus californianus]